MLITIYRIGVGDTSEKVQGHRAWVLTMGCRMRRTRLRRRLFDTWLVVDHVAHFVQLRMCRHTERWHMQTDGEHTDGYSTGF